METSAKFPKYFSYRKSSAYFVAANECCVELFMKESVTSCQVPSESAFHVFEGTTSSAGLNAK